MSLAELETHEVRVTGHAMATDITVRAVTGEVAADRRATTVALEAALAVFHEVETACTRFDPTSPLMRANAAPDRWHVVPPILLAALEEAQRAHESTGRRFDPRVLSNLVALGYDRSLPFAGGAVECGDAAAAAPGSRGPWRPRFRRGASEVHLGGGRVDLGGIGKGLAIRWASEQIARVAPNHLVEAGGDCRCSGAGPDGRGWRVGIEDPLGGSEPVAVLAVADRAVTTSSVRLRHWRAGGRAVHHLIDPRTGRPGGAGLLAVTVVGDDPARAEVWSKVLFLEGARDIAARARRRGLAAAWVDDAGELAWSPGLERHLLWHRP